MLKNNIIQKQLSNSLIQNVICKGFLQQTEQTMHNGCLSFSPYGFFSWEYRFTTFDSSPLSFRSERNLVLKPAEDLDPGSIPG